MSARTLLVVSLAMTSQAFAANLTVDGTTITLSGNNTYGVVQVINGGKIIVPAYDGTDRINSGNLVIKADSITVDATSSIVARGSGYQRKLCSNGTGPNATAGGRGGCALFDSGGGGAHFGNGGRGTKDIPAIDPGYPTDYEEDCGDSINAAGTSCTTTANCRNNDALPTVAGQAFTHSIWAVEFGAAGGDKGCRDGFDNVSTGGSGGGRIVLAAVNAGKTGLLTINGVIDANGNRGCGNGNDSAGGGAGGSVLLVGDTVSITGTAIVTAAGGRGGDTQPKSDPECTGTQTTGTCDDCGGGGGIINVLSTLTSTIDPAANFNVSGAFGGVCPICTGEAGGGAGELQIDGAYVGEICDGFDNDFDTVADNGFGNVSCGLGACATPLSSCVAGSPPICAPTTTGPTCFGSRGTSRPRIALLLDSSASMLLTLKGTPTFGDGSADHGGIDLSGDSVANDSRLFLAKTAVAQLMSAYPEIDFALARYHQDQALNRSCQTAKWLECQGTCCSYDNPKATGGTGPTSCTLTLTRNDGTTFAQAVQENYPLAGRCINYAGTCGSPRRGADILVGFESDVRQYISWLDGGETNFSPSATPGNYCGGLTGDCELRGTGPTPIAESLRALYDYVTPIQTEDPAAACRGYSVILVSDGGEECGGQPTTAAAELLAKGIKTYVIGVSVDAAQGATLKAVAAAGGTTDFIPVNNSSQLLPALVSIVSGSIRTELCNGIDDNCNGVTDEGFNVGAACDNGKVGACRSTGVLECDPADSKKTRCKILVTGVAPTAELCNGKDDNCDGAIDEGNPQGGAACGSAVGECKKGTLVCQGGKLDCVGDVGPKTEVCNGKDDDCNNAVDNGVPPGGPCGSSVGECKPGLFQCQGALGYVCVGDVKGGPETCNGKDDDCNGAIDDNVPGTGVACNALSDGTPLCKPGVVRCIAGAIQCVGGRPFHAPQCTCPPDDCSQPTDGGLGTNGCPSGSACIACGCRTACGSSEFPCSGNLVCREGFCVPPECGGRLCTSAEVCTNDHCVDICTTITCPGTLACKAGICVENTCYGVGCPTGQLCQSSVCVPDPCAGVDCAVDEFCRQGQCVRSCEGVYCPSDQSCQAGACVPNLCAAVKCNPGSVCAINGAGVAACSLDPCAALSCGLGRVCKAGNCIDDPCLGVHCPGDPGQVACVLGECQPRIPVSPPLKEVRIAPTGGGGVFGCTMTPAGSSGGAVWVGVAFLLFALAVRRRSRS